MLRRSVLAVGLLASSGAASAAALHVNIQAIAGKQQTVAVNQQLPQRFVAAASFDDGAPVVGLQLQFGVNVCMNSEPAPGSSGCPEPAAYGHFLGTATATTDAGGKAMSPPFVAGSAAGSYSIYVSRANWSQLIDGQTVTDLPIAASVSNVFQVIQAPAPAVDAAPALSAPLLILLALLLTGMAYRRVAA